MNETKIYKFNIEKKIFFLPERNQLVVDDLAVRMEPLQVKLLQVLIEHHHEVMSASRIARLVWQRENVSDNLVRQVISQLRIHLSDTERPYKTIQTVPKKGYFLLPEVIPCDEPSITAKPVNPSLKAPPPIGKREYQKTITMLTGFATLFVVLFFTNTYLKENTSTSEPLSVYLSSSTSDKTVDDDFIASMKNYIYYTLKTTKNINVYLQNKIPAHLEQEQKTYSLITRFYRQGEESRLAVNLYDPQNELVNTFSTTFSKNDFLSQVGSLTLDIKRYLSPNTTNNSIFFKPQQSTYNYDEWKELSDSVVGLYQGRVKSTIEEMPKLIKLKNSGSDSYLINALLAYSYSVKYLNNRVSEDKETALRLSQLAFSQDPLCDISNVSLGLALIINNKATEAYPYLYYAIENAASPLSYYLISLSAALTGNKLGAERYKEKFMQFNQQAGDDFELSITEASPNNEP
ncbi:winged helix-turn-helix domain-containing protein [Aeromonas sp. 603696]|uniref:transcriptional regulator n=1 Tax=Aeromonas sp. 603696 TaxID=2712049 RepID=UPI003BA2F4B2